MLSLPLTSSPEWNPSPKQRSSWLGHFSAQQRRQVFDDWVRLHAPPALLAFEPLLPHPPSASSSAAKQIRIAR